MTLAASIKQFVTELAISARIVSPRFTDYRIESFDYYTEPAEFDSILKAEVERIIEEKMVEMKGTKESKSPPMPEGAGMLGLIGKGARTGMGGGMALVGTMARLFPPAMIALAIPFVVNAVLDELTKVGGVLDVRYRREITNEIENYWSRQVQYDTAVGNRQVILQTKASFGNLRGAGNSNTLRQVRENVNRLADVGLHVEDKAQGLERGWFRGMQP